MRVNDKPMDTKNKYYTIFVVEDSDVYRSLLIEDLESENETPGTNIRYQVYGFASGEECMEQIALKKPDIMITDYLLNGNGYTGNMNGIELLRSIRNMFPKLDVIVLSCHENAKVIGDLMQVGIRKYLKKESLGHHKVKLVVNELIQERERRSNLIKFSVAAAFILIVSVLLFLFM